MRELFKRMVTVLLIGALLFALVDPILSLPQDRQAALEVRERREQLLAESLLIIRGLVSAEAALEDIQQLFAELESAHPSFLQSPFVIRICDEAYQRARQELVQSITGDIEIRRLALYVNRFLSVLGDGHTVVRFTDLGLSALQESFHWNAERLLLEPGAAAPEGAVVLTIGGVCVEEIGLFIDQFATHENEHGRYYNRWTLVRTDLMLSFAGAQLYNNQVELLVEHGDGAQEVISLRFAPFMHRSSLSALGSHPGGDAFRYQLLENGTVAYIMAYSARMDESWLRMLEFLEDALEANITNVIIDVSKNPGGLAQTWDWVYRLLGMSHAYTQYLRRLSPLYLARSDRYNTSARRFISQRRLQYVRHGRGTVARSNPEINLVVLSTEMSASAATIFLYAVKDSSLGTIIGRETRNPKPFPAGAIPIWLQNSGIGVNISTMLILRGRFFAPPRAQTGEPLIDIYVPYGECLIARALEYFRTLGE